MDCLSRTSCVLLICVSCLVSASDKLGLCPPPPMGADGCVVSYDPNVNCHSDLECPGDLKCCINDGCNKVCMRPHVMSTQNPVVTSTILSTTTAPGPVPTTRAPVKPSLCYTCGDLDNDMPCTRLELVLDNPFQCPADMPFCMNDIYQEAGMPPAVFKRCVDELGCQTEWYQESSDKAACFRYDPSVYTKDLVCHLCCHGDACNAQLLPEMSTLYKP